jgi:gamma-glutamyltranspeptidase/glutathione hydrolase
MTRWLLISFVLAGVLLVWNSPCLAQSRVVPEPPRQSVQSAHTSTSAKNMVASVHPLATQAGVNAFENGGNAVDAAIATALTLGVVDGYNSGIGGGCFVLIRKADGQFFAIDGREMAPAKAYSNLYRDALRDAANTNDKPSRVGALASGVPGALAAYHQAATQHGRLKFKDLILPAAKLAEGGFIVTEAYASRLRTSESNMRQFPGSRAVFFRKQSDQPESKLKPYEAGERLVQKDLANTYRQIAANGPSWFYNGPFAIQTEAWMNANRGIMTARDFANYRTVDRTPIRTTYRGYEIVGFPPPSSGGVHVAQILNILESFDLKQIYENDPAQMYHLVAEAMKFAFADRAEWLGDPDFVDVPIGLVDKGYAKQIAAKIKLDSVVAADHGMPPGAGSKFFERHTTHVAAADAEGNWVALTTTVNTTFGAKYVVPGLGVVMNNQMDDFVANPGQPNAFGLIGGENNAVASKKRPLSSMSPTIVLKNGQPVFTAGAAGGPKIITEVIWAIINHIDLELPVGQAIARPRLHHQWVPASLLLESSFDSAMAARLAEFGHNIRRSSSMGICQAISYDPKTQTFVGAHDPRTTGQAMGQR